MLDYKFIFNYLLTLTKLCHIKHDYPVHIICSKCPLSAKTHALTRLRKLLIALLIVVCGKPLYNEHFYNVNKHVGYDMTSPMTSFVQQANIGVNKKAQLTLTNPCDAKGCKNCSNSTCFV